jgi:signal transduction histidine kinase
MRIRTRLLLSFIFVLAATLAVIAVALILFIVAQPTPQNEVFQKLGTIMRDLSVELQELRFRELRELPARLTTFAEENDVRVLVINADGLVTIDSSGVFQASQSLPLQPGSVTQLPGYLRRGLPLDTEPLLGDFTDASGQWLFTGLQLHRRGGPGGPLTGGAILLAEQPIRRTLAESLTIFRNSLATPLAQAALVGLLVALALSAFISRTLANGLQSLSEAAHAIAKGNYAWKVKPSGPPEVRDVAEAFNRMSQQVHDTQRAQQDFLANVSHDLKTPLTSIQGYSQAIMDGAAKDSVGAARIIHDEAGRLNRMVIELTDLARLQSGQFSFQMKPVDLAALNRAVGERLSIMAERKGVRLNVETSSVGPVQADGDRLAQVLTNLVGNAINHTPAGGTIWLRAGAATGGVTISVQDTGAGIPPAELERIFERFYQVDPARGPKRGTGLGLAIAHEIVTAHGGTIRAASEGQGKGATFTVWLPVGKPGASGKKQV